ncbi:hypothetical protein N7488_006639 [Penicillium malachiteum]|nr:hypothetical protein N7488_006639 [Penicillium malachiteum]
MSGPLYFAGLFSSLIVLFLLKYAIKSRRPQNFPPGPRGLPIIGNIHQLPLRKGFLVQKEWSKQYGTIIGFKLGPLNAVVLNSYHHVKELFDKRGAIYSSRPENYAAQQIICPNNIHILLAEYGPQWRALRKAVQGLLNINADTALHPIQVSEATQTMCQLLEDPENYDNHIRRYATAVILASVFGQRGEKFESSNVQALYHAQERFTGILEPGSTPPIDAFPFLRSLPEFMSPWKKEAKEIRLEQSVLYYGLLNETKARLSQKNLQPCFMEKLLASQERDGFTDEHLAYLGGVLMEGGSDTTSSTLLAFVLAMASHPHVLRKAQEELDRVCGNTRSPGFYDLPKLEYMRASDVLIADSEQTLRWRPMAPVGIPHMLTQDDTYEGYFIPKGTIMFMNTWAIHMDEDEYDEPEEFKPERFINNKFGCKDGKNLDEQRRVTYGFGAGRRSCAGQRMAENSLMINMSKMVWLFNVLPLGSEPLDVSISSFDDGILVAPKKFPVQFVPRSDVHVQVIRDELEEAKELFARYK